MSTATVDFHLAQCNIARMRAPLEDPLMADFASSLDRINALAEASPGFVWRFMTEEGDATAVRPLEDETILFNMSVWTSVDALFQYTYKSDHVSFLARRKEWFSHTDGPSVVLWWVPAGHQPGVEDALRRLTLLGEKGPTPEAFGIAKPFPPPDGP